VSQKLDSLFQELDAVALTRDIREQGLKQGDIGAVVHCYADGIAFEVEFVNAAGDSLALLTLTKRDIQPINSDSIDRKAMADKPKVNMNFHAPVYGAAGNVEGDQIVNASQPNLDEILTEIAQIIRNLQQKHPDATEAEAEEIIEAEFEEIRVNQPNKWQTFRRELLNRERWFNGGKAALSETAKHFVDNNVYYKAGLAFLEGFSADD
jgi:Domain of unknown function (DUF4926)